MNEVPPGRPWAMTFHSAHQGCGLPVALSAEAEAVGHETLGGDARELAKAMKVLEVVGECAETALDEKGTEAEFDFKLVYRLRKRLLNISRYAAKRMVVSSVSKLSRIHGHQRRSSRRRFGGEPWVTALCGGR